MKLLKRLFLAAMGLTMALPASASIYNFGLFDAPNSAPAGQTYTVSAVANFEPDYYDDWGYAGPGAYGNLYLYRNGSWVASSSGWYSLWVGASFSDSSGQVIAYSAEADDDNGNWDVTPEHYVTISGYSPQASISIDGHSSGATIMRPAGGSVIVTVRYTATDADGNLTGIRPQVWHPGSGYFYDNNGSFESRTGGSGEVVRTVTLDRDGAWRFWTDAQDVDLAASGNLVNSGPWNSGFLINVVEQQADPQVNFSVSQTTMYVGETITLTSYAADGNSDLAFHSFWWDQGLGYTWTSPQFYYDGFGPNAAGWSNISNWHGSIANAGGQTITANWTAFAPGTYYFHSNAYDSRGVWGNGAVHTVTVVNRPPSVSYVIIDSNTGAHLTPSNGKVTIAPNTNFLVQVTGSDPDGRLSRLYLRMNNPAGQNVVSLDVPASGTVMGHNFPVVNSGTTPGTWDIWVHARESGSPEWGGAPDFNGNNYGWATQGSPDLLVAAVPSSLTLIGPPSTLLIGQSFGINSTAHDADGDLAGHSFWARGPRSTDSFGDWDGWGYNGFSNWSNPGAPTNGTNSTITATFTPSQPGYWQFHASAWDQYGNWHPTGITTGAVFVAPIPSATITVSGNGASVSGGGALTVYTGQTVAIASTATAAGWLSEHATLIYTNSDYNNVIGLPNGQVALPGNAGATNSERNTTWTPSAAGTYTVYSEAFTGRWASERVGMVSGWAGFSNSSAAQRVTVTVRNPEAGSITNSGAGYGAESFDVYINNVRGAVGIACPTWTAANGQDDLSAGWETHGYEAVHEPQHDRWRFRVYRTAHNKEYGHYIVHLYARNAAGHLTFLGSSELNMLPPKIDAVTPSRGLSVDGNPYKIYVTGAAGVSQMYFPTWTEANGQDDLAPAWWTVSNYQGTFDSGNNRWEFSVNRAHHNNEFGLYHTQVWVVDSLGERVMYPLGSASVTVTNAAPTASITVLDEQRQPAPILNNRATIKSGGVYYLKVSGYDPEGVLDKLYIRAALNGSEFITQEQAVSGTSASHEFGPFTASTTPTVIDLWAHSRDINDGWGTANGPDLQINTAPVGSIDSVNVQSGTITASGWAVDREEGAPIARVAVYVDDVFIANASLGSTRSDIASHAIGVLGYEGDASRYLMSGWNVTFSFGNILPGARNLSVRLHDVLGAQTQIAALQFTIPMLDSDQDGMDDRWENNNNLNANSSADASVDIDGDGLTNLAEFNLGKNPRVYDSGASLLGATIPAGWPSADTVTQQAVGATAGELSVDKSGATTYQIPIAASPGTAGMQPNLSLSYSSQGGAGIAGFGWSLTGLSSISRGPQTMAVDGQVRGVDFSNQDRFYLDGQRLIPISGNNGENGTEYRTEIDSFSRIVSYGGAGNGPARWRVWTKAGLVIELGYTADSQFCPYRKNGVYFTAGAEALTWSVSRIYDTLGNYMSFSYTENESEGYSLLSRIDYTGHLNPVVAPYASIRFEYEARPDTSTGYSAGARMSSSQRLKHVRAYYGETVVRTYSLSYVARNYNQRSLLSSLTETGSDGKPYHPLTFDYSEPSIGWEQLNTEKWAPPIQFIASGNPPRRYGAGFADLDGDGRPDIMQWYHDSSGNGDHRRTAWMNLPASGFASNWFGLTNAQPPFALAYENRKDTGARMVDFDGDGLLDMIWHHVQNNGAVESEAYRNSGNHWNEPYGWHSIPQYRVPFPLGQDNANPAFASNFIDLNGDGRVDVVGRTDHTYHAYLNTGSGWQHAPQWNTPCFLGEGTSFMDVTGDGLPDLIQNWYGDYHSRQGVWFNNGNGWTACPSGQLGNYLPPLMTSKNPEYGSNSPMGTEFTDLNGDGLVDCIARNDAGGNYIAPQAWLNTGRGWERATSYDPPVALRHDHISRGIVFIDVNADGLVDLVRSYSGGSNVFLNTGRGWTQVDGAAILPMIVYYEGWKNENITDLIDLDADGAVDQIGHWGYSRGAYRNLANPIQDRLVKVRNAFGVEARIAYGPLTARDAQTGDFTLYEKGDGSVFPKVEVVAPMYVTQSVSHDDGAGGQYSINYRYGKLRSHAYRGSLGFEWMQSTDARTGIRSKTWFNQEYPYVGMPSASETRTAANALLSESIVTYQQKTLNGGATRFPYASESIQRSYELNGALMSESITISQYDDWGNATRLEIDSLDGHEKVTVSTYDNWIQPASESGLGGWLLGRLKRSEVTATSPTAPSQTRVSSFGYNSTTGLLTSEVVEPDRASDSANYTLTTSYGHDAFGNKTSVSTTGGGLDAPRTATTVYDTRGRFPNSTANALNHGETYTYDQAKGVLLTSTGPNNLTTTWEFDGFARKTKEIRADTTVTTIRYSWPGAGTPAGTKYFIETESSGGPPAIACYDAMGRAFMGYSINGGKIDGNARIVVQKTEYDSMGRAYRASLPYYLNEPVPGWIQTTAFDVLNRPLTVVTPNDDVPGGQASSSVAYAGLVTTTTNAKGQIERIEKNSQGQVTRRVNNAGASAGSVERGEVSYTYDAFGQLLTTTVYKENGAQISTSLTYDVRGRKTSMVDPDMGTWSYLYNAAGELIWQKDAKNQETSMEYDALGRLVRREERVSAGANPVVTVWGYDTATGASIGKLHTITTTGDGANASVGNNETYAYDSFGRVNQSTRLINGQTFTLHQAFDSFGRLSVSTYPTGFQVRNVYNTLGFLKEVRRADSGRNDLYWAADSYALDGRVNGEYFGNGMAVDRVYSQVTGRLRMSQSGVSYAATRAQDLSYTYDVLGNVMSRVDNAMGRSESFGYDGLNRLTNHTVAGGALVTLSYDSLGNITHKSDVGIYTYHSTRRHAVTNTTGGVGLLASDYFYDGNGNMTSGAGRTYTWTLANQMKKAEKAGIWSEFQFDASRQRVLQTNNLGQTTYYVSGSFEEVRHSGGLIERKYYVSAPTGRVAVRVERNNGAHETRWFHSDGLGSINAISDERGTILQRFAYDAWGKRTNPANGASITSGTNSGISRGYTDHEHLDDLGLTHMNGRVYDPVQGRFLSADPIVQDAGYSQCYNRFSYCINNPMCYTDPSGYSFWDKVKKTARLDLFLPGVGSDPVYWLAPEFHSKYAGQVLGIAASAVVMYYTSNLALAGAAGGYASGFASSLLNGGSLGDAFEAGMIGAGYGAAVGTATMVFGAVGGAAVSGWISENNGGKFWAGFGASMAGSIGGMAGNYAANSNWYAGLVVSAVAGGTAAEIGGGKFANGAATAAFQYLIYNPPTAKKLGFATQSGNVEATLNITDRGTIQLDQAPDTGEGVYIGRGVTFDAVVSGVPLSDIEIRQTIVEGSATDAATGKPVVFARNKPDGGYYKVSQLSGGASWVGGVGTDQNGLYLTPEISQTQSQVRFRWYDGPGQARTSGQAGVARTNNMLFRTDIMQSSSNQVLASRLWSISTTLNPDGSGSTSFRLIK